MQLNVKGGALLAGLSLLITGCGVVGGKYRVKAPADAGVAQAEGPSAPYNAAESAPYDDVGYASWYPDEPAGHPTAVGEPYNPDGISAAHASLPIPSFIEVTNLKTGKTILVRVIDRGPRAPGGLIDLSRGAAAALGAEGEPSFAVRVRRVNPSEEEKGALQNGRSAAPRLDTPEPLLAALRRKMGSAPMAPVAATPSPSLPSQRIAPVTPQPARTGGRRRPGADYGNPPVPGEDRGVSSQQPAPVRATAPPSQPQGQGEFVVEEAGRPRGPAPQPATTGAYFVQIAAFSDRQRAENLARQVGGRVVRSGTIWRVKVGPFASLGAAQAALRDLRAKGYRDARVTN